MFEVFALLFVCSLIAFLYSSNAKKYDLASMPNAGKLKYENGSAKFYFVLLVLILVCFSGLRTKMNDTATYLSAYNSLPSGLGALKDINWEIGSNPLFYFYQVLLKTLVSENGSVFIFVTSCFVSTSMLCFLRKYSPCLWFSVFAFIAFYVFGFTMAAMKQTIATAIGIWSTPLFLDKKYIKATILLLIGALFHPYVIIYLFAPVFVKNIWDKKTVLLLVGTVIVAFAYDAVMSTVLSIADSIGDSYDAELFSTSQNGTNIFRLMVYCVVPVLSFIYRKNIRGVNNGSINIAVNLSIVSSCFMVFAGMGSANMFGRLANYFDIFQCIALPTILYYGEKSILLRKIILVVALICFSVFYYVSYSKYGTGLWTCFYNHISIFDLIRNW